MKRSRFMEEQIIGVLREQESGQKTADVYRRHGISEGTFYKWKSKFGGMEVSDAKHLKALETENAKLKKLLAETTLDNAMLKDINAKKVVTPAARRSAVAHLREVYSVSERRACRAIGADRSSVRYRSVRSEDDGCERCQRMTDDSVVGRLSQPPMRREAQAVTLGPRPEGPRPGGRSLTPYFPASSSSVL